MAQDFGGHKPQANATYQQSLKTLPTDPALQNNRAFFLAENGGNLDEACAKAGIDKISARLK